MRRPLIAEDSLRCVCCISYIVQVCPVSEFEMDAEKDGTTTESTLNVIRRGRRSQTAFFLNSFLYSNRTSVQKLYMVHLLLSIAFFFYVIASFIKLLKIKFFQVPADFIG